MKLPNKLQTVRLLTDTPPHQRFIFGTGRFARMFHEMFPFAAFVETKPARSELLGIPVLSLNEIPADAQIVNASCIWPFTANATLIKAGFYACHVLYAAKEILGANFYFPQFASQLERDEGTFQDLRNNLSDNQSKDLLDSVLEFRITGDVNYLYGKKSINPQYFEDFIDFNSLFTFFDVGAFDDENANRFVALNPNFKRIHLFEPNPQAYAHLKNSFVNNPRVVCSELAISDLKGQASFESRLGTSSRLIDEGDFEVKTEILDSFINESPDYIKFDIEGMELRALKGSLKTISQLKPNLAVSVYHESSHLFEVYSLLRHYYADAKFYLRLYTEGTDELILYVLRNVDKPNPL